MTQDFERPAVINVLESCATLGTLPPDARDQLAARCYMTQASRGEVIWLASTPVEFVAVVGKGFVKMCKSTVRGQDVAMELFGPGQCLGLMVAVEGKTYPLSAVAVTDVWYLKIPVAEFTSVYASHPGLREQMLQTMVSRLKKAHHMVARMSSDKVEQRMAAVLLILNESYGRSCESGIELVVPLMRQDLAELAGTTVETSIRIMSRWQKQGTLTTEQQRITILDADALLAMLED